MSGLGNTVKRIAMVVAKAGMSGIYAMDKLGRVEPKVCMISRESNTIPFEFEMLREELESRGIETSVHAMMLKKNYAEYLIELMRQMKDISSSKVLLIDTYSIPASVLKHREDLTVIQMWHALAAIKKFGWQTVGREDGSSELVAEGMNMHGGYDYVMCSSDVTAKHFSEAFRQPISKMLKIGLPRIDRILEEKPELVEEIRNRYNPDGKKLVVYVPTYRKNRPVEWKALYDALDKDRYSLVMKLHPIDAATVDASVDGVICDTSYNTYDLLKAADIVISDYSSFVVEASLALKPMFLYVYDIDEYTEKVGLNMNYEEEAIGKYVFRDAKELARAMDTDYDLAAIEAFRDKYIDVDRINCTRQLADKIETLI